MFSPPEMEVGVLNNRKNNIDEKVQKFEKNLEKSLTVSYRDNFNEYLRVSTLHGLRYVGDRTITLFERFLKCSLVRVIIRLEKHSFVYICRAFFIGVFLLVIFLSVFFISNVWIKWSKSPVIIVSIDFFFSKKVQQKN